MCTHPKAVQPLPLTEPAPAFDRVTSHFPGRITLPSLCSMGCAATGSVVRWPSSPYHGTRACRNTPPRSKHRKTQTWFSEPREVVYLGDSTCPAGLVREGWIHGVNRVGAKQRPRSKLGQHLGERQMQPHYQCCHGTAGHARESCHSSHKQGWCSWIAQAGTSTDATAVAAGGGLRSSRTVSDALVQIEQLRAEAHAHQRLQKQRGGAVVVGTDRRTSTCDAPPTVVSSPGSAPPAQHAFGRWDTAIVVLTAVQ
jgi:hypothetical protein